MKKVVILADGEFPRHPEPLSRLSRAEAVVCCDGAADKLLRFGRVPDWIVGDLDSVSPATRARFADRLVKFSEQETNDLAKSFRFCRENALSVTAVLGAGGGREDHLLGNLARFAEASAYFPGCRLCTERGFFLAFSGEGKFDAAVGTQVSIFSFDPSARITSSGLKYPLEDLALPWWYSGTLNEVETAPFTLRSDSSAPVLLFFRYGT